MAAGRIVRIGGASGFWGDSRVAAPQLVRSGPIDYLVFDYLAETTMAILAAARLKKPELGYATDFVEVAMRSVLGEIAAKKIKVVSNAGGIHPRACVARRSRRSIAEAGLALKVAVVEGDDVSAQMRVARRRRHARHVQRRAVARARRSAPTPISARCRSRARSPPAPTSSSPAASSTARSRSGR